MDNGSYDERSALTITASVPNLFTGRKLCKEFSSRCHPINVYTIGWVIIAGLNNCVIYFQDQL